MDNRNFAFGKRNFVALAAGIIVILIGFALMSSGSSTEERFDASIFDTRRIVVAPIVTFVGFASIIYAIILKPKDDTSENAEE